MSAYSPEADGSLRYQNGFGNELATEALPGALPPLRHSPQRCPYGLYAEQWSGTAFTAPRHDSRRSWLYRIRPAAMHGDFVRMAQPLLAQVSDYAAATPNRLRWNPLPIPTADPTDFVDGLFTLGGNAHTGSGRGCAVHWYVANRSMQARFFYDADAELLIVPQTGRLRIATELGVLALEPLEIAVIPRGLRFRIELLDAAARGYVCENFGAPLRLPELGPIGSNGLARAHDFEAPVAAYEDVDGDFELIAKFAGALWRAPINHSPLDVVAWRGTNAPFKYDLRRFNTIGSISYDHPDPSIFLVLQSLGDQPGADELDFVIFPPRWLVMTDTFRPPWFHRNVASELMGLIDGEYDAKQDGFLPGGASLHNCMSAHGPDAPSFEKGRRADTTKPEFVGNTMAFMFEARLPIHATPAALGLPQRQHDYGRCWQTLPKHFSPDAP